MVCGHMCGRPYMASLNMVSRIHLLGKYHCGCIPGSVLQTSQICTRGRGGLSTTFLSIKGVQFVSR